MGETLLLVCLRRMTDGRLSCDTYSPAKGHDNHRRPEHTSDLWQHSYLFPLFPSLISFLFNCKVSISLLVNIITFHSFFSVIDYTNTSLYVVLNALLYVCVLFKAMVSEYVPLYFICLVLIPSILERDWIWR